jgi:hypothetical protein
VLSDILVGSFVLVRWLFRFPCAPQKSNPDLKRLPCSASIHGVNLQERLAWDDMVGRTATITGSVTLQPGARN